MSVILRPVVTLVSTNLASGDHTAIDEVSPSDSDYLRTNQLDDTETAQFVCLLSPVAGRPGPGLSTLRIRWQVESGTDDLTFRYRIFCGATQITSGFQQVETTGIWWTDTFAYDLDAITDWADVRLQLDFTAFPGAFNVRGRVSWVELEVPDLLPPSGMMLMF